VSGPIQTFPAGLLGFLGLKNGGQNPDVLLNEVRAGIDLTNFYAYGLESEQGSDSLPFALGGGTNYSAFFTVPAKKVWYVKWIQLFLGSQAVPNAIGTVQFGFADPQGLFRRTEIMEYAPVANKGINLVWKGAPFFAGPGWRLYVRMSDAAGSACSCNATMSYSEFQL